MEQRPDLFWGVVASMYVGNVFLLLLNLPLVGLWVQLLRVPYRVLFPIVLLLSVVGAYSANKNVFDLWVMLGSASRDTCCESSNTTLPRS